MKCYDISIYKGTRKKIWDLRNDTGTAYEEEKKKRLERVKASIICKPLLDENNIVDVAEYWAVLHETYYDEKEKLDERTLHLLKEEIIRAGAKFHELDKNK